MPIAVGYQGGACGFGLAGEFGGQFLGSLDTQGSELFDLAHEVAGSLVQFLVGLFPDLVRAVQGRADAPQVLHEPHEFVIEPAAAGGDFQRILLLVGQPPNVGDCPQRREQGRISDQHDIPFQRFGEQAGLLAHRHKERRLDGDIHQHKVRRADAVDFLVALGP